MQFKIIGKKRLQKREERSVCERDETEINFLGVGLVNLFCI